MAREKREGDRRGQRTEEGGRGRGLRESKEGGMKGRKEGRKGIGQVERRNKQESMNVYTLGYPFLASSQELSVERLINQQLLSSEVKAKKR